MCRIINETETGLITALSVTCFALFLKAISQWRISNGVNSSHFKHVNRRPREPHALGYFEHKTISEQNYSCTKLKNNTLLGNTAYNSSVTVSACYQSTFLTLTVQQTCHNLTTTTTTAHSSIHWTWSATQQTIVHQHDFVSLKRPSQFYTYKVMFQRNC